jgi:hypothetical protein
VAKAKKQASEKKPKKVKAPATRAGPKKSPAAKTVDKAVRGAKAKAKELAANPAIAEIVAASLVAAAAAIKNPKKARDMASAVGNELETASKQAVDRGNNFWQLAIDIARRSIEALGPDSSPAKSKNGTKKKSKK